MLLISPLSRGIDAVLHKVAEQLLTALDKVSFEATLNLGNLIIVLVADTTVRNLAGGAQLTQKGSQQTAFFLERKTRLAPTLRVCGFSRIIFTPPRPLEGEYWGRSVESSLPIMQNEKRQLIAVSFVS